MFVDGLLQIVPGVDAGTEGTTEKSFYKLDWPGRNAYDTASPELAGHLLLESSANYSRLGDMWMCKYRVWPLVCQVFF